MCFTVSLSCLAPGKGFGHHGAEIVERVCENRYLQNQGRLRADKFEKGLRIKKSFGIQVSSMPQSLHARCNAHFSIARVCQNIVVRGPFPKETWVLGGMFFHTLLPKSNPYGYTTTTIKASILLFGSHHLPGFGHEGPEASQICSATIA